MVSRLDFAGNHHLRDGVAQFLTDDTQYRTCTILLVVATQGDGLAGFWCQLQRDVLLGQQLQQSLHVNIEDSCHGLVGNRREWYDFRQTSQELRTEVALHDVHQFVVLGYLTTVESRNNILGADVRCEQNQGIREITHTT